jgi:hypothetical protein
VRKRKAMLYPAKLVIEIKSMYGEDDIWEEFYVDCASAMKIRIEKLKKMYRLENKTYKIYLTKSSKVNDIIQTIGLQIVKNKYL